IQKYSDPPIRLVARCRNDPHTGRRQVLVRCFEIVYAEEQSNAPGELLADDSRLLLAISACQENAGLAADRPDHDPPLVPPVVWLRRRVLHELKLQDIDKESNGAVVSRTTSVTSSRWDMGVCSRVQVTPVKS